MNKIYFLRHGQTDWNALGKIQGCVDNPLNATGIKQAEEEKLEVDKLDIDICITSPLSRAKDRAKIVIGDRDIKIIEDERIIERSYGDWEGISYEEADKLQLRVYKENPTPVPNGETFDDVMSRVEAFLDDVKAKYQGKNVLVVAHGGIARCLKIYFEGNEHQKTQVHRTPNCKVVEYDIEVK
ncbi:MAG: histidine phosphatase family protein [Clostridiales bacterium]|jgi:broad specificity phosphatase PhoE|nr:histidine phosphatase family protein [Clostridiales bacterium]